MRRTEKIGWADRVRNEVELHNVKEKNIVHRVLRRKLNALFISCVVTAV